MLFLASDTVSTLSQQASRSDSLEQVVRERTLLPVTEPYEDPRQSSSPSEAWFH